MKFLIVLCFVVLAAQALPELKAPIDDIVRDLEDLNKEVTRLQTEAIERLSLELASVDEASKDLLHNLGEHLQSDVGTLQEEIHELEREARQYRVDISECVGDTLEHLADLPNEYIGEAGLCLNLGHAQAENAVDEGLQKITVAIGPIDEYWREVQKCQEADRHEQDICVAALETEIKNDEIQIPSKIHLAVQEVVGHLEAEKVSLLLCTSDKSEKLNEEGRHVVDRVTECAERLFPRHQTN